MYSNLDQTAEALNCRVIEAAELTVSRAGSQL